MAEDSDIWTPLTQATLDQYAKLTAIGKYEFDSSCIPNSPYKATVNKSHFVGNLTLVGLAVASRRAHSG